LATVNPNFNPSSINALFTPVSGAAASQQAALVASTNFGSVSSGIDQAQQMLSALVQLQASWVGIGGGQPIGDGSLPSLGAALSSQYAAMTFGSPGNASDLGSLQSNLRGMYAPVLPGMTDDLTKIAPPLGSAYAQLMGNPGTGIPGMPLTKPLVLGEVTTTASMLAQMPKAPKK
jgi:hypothetical protein